MNATKFLPLALAAVLLVQHGASGQVCPPDVPPFPVGTAFTYQGLLTFTNPAGQTSLVDDTCDFAFSLWDCEEGGSTIAGPLDLIAQEVTAGHFTVQLDFGNLYQGDARFLEVTVTCPQPFGGPVTLTPRQELTPAPHALYTAGAPWDGLLNVPADFADGTDDDTLAGLLCTDGEIAKWNNGTGQWECAADDSGVGGANTLDEAYDGGGAGAGRTITADAGAVQILGPGGLTVGNSITIDGFSTPNTISSDDADGLELHVASGRALRIGSNATSPNLIGGYSGNSVEPGVIGATIAGGGASFNENSVFDNHGTVGGGGNNQAGSDDGNPITAIYATVGGGRGNTASGWRSTIGGGLFNTSTGERSTIGGGGNNTASGQGGTIAGGIQNSTSGNLSTIGGGFANTANGINTTVAGGQQNNATSDNATVGGGVSNTGSGFSSTVGGGLVNTANGINSTVAGGAFNTASGIWATVPGGNFNTAGGDYSFAVGRRAKANHDGAFVWADSTNADFASTAPDQFLIRAASGVGINTDAPAAALHIGGLPGVDGLMFPDGTLQTTAAAGGGGAATLDEAYDGGGAGVGRTITADSGAVNIAGPDGLSINGDVGIGTTTPSEKLDVIGNVHASGTITSGSSIIIDGTNDTITSNGDLELHVSDGRALRLETNATSPNLIGGFGGNSVESGTVGATLGGGGAFAIENRVFDNYGTVGGGLFNRAGSDDANPATAISATVGGGENNSASDFFATVGGGSANTASAAFATVGGGSSNTASGNAATVGGGGGNTAASVSATVGGGILNTASGTEATVGGGESNTASGVWSTVGGGDSNTATGQSTTVGGGSSNAASGLAYATVSGGVNNTASGVWSTVAGGTGNTASGDSATVGGGGANTASGGSSMVLGGQDNLAAGLTSLAAGNNAKANNSGMFVWADGFSTDFPSATETNFTPAVHQFLARASGGVVFVSAIDGVTGDSTAGVELVAGGGSWSSLSSRDAKANVNKVDGREILELVQNIPIATWNYKAQDESIRHIGPMAQDFYAAFGVGEKETMITTIDADGVALAAIQGLYEIVKDQRDQIEGLQASVTALEDSVRKMNPSARASTFGVATPALVVVGLLGLVATGRSRRGSAR